MYKDVFQGLHCMGIISTEQWSTSICLHGLSKDAENIMRVQGLSSASKHDAV